MLAIDFDWLVFVLLSAVDFDGLLLKFRLCVLTNSVYFNVDSGLVLFLCLTLVMDFDDLFVRC